MSYHIYRYTMVVIGCLITASAINLFYIPNMLLSGGITGLGFLIYYLTGLPIGMMNIVLNIPLFYLAWKYMDKEYFFGSLASMTFLSLAIDALHFLTAYTPDVPEKMLSCITGGVMYGAAPAAWILSAALLTNITASAKAQPILFLTFLLCSAVPLPSALKPYFTRC